MKEEMLNWGNEKLSSTFHAWRTIRRHSHSNRTPPLNLLDRMTTNERCSRKVGKVGERARHVANASDLLRMKRSKGLFGVKLY